MVKVMLVEDDPTMLSLLNTLLEMEGYEVVHLDKFNNILGDIHSQNPDLILMDVHLEDLDGIQVLETIRKDNGLHDLKIVMSSGIDFKEDSLAKGANEFLLKPYMPEELISKIKLLLSK